MRYKGTQASHLYEKSMHTLCTISEQPLLAKASIILNRSLSHTCAHSAIMVSTLLLSTGALGSITCSGMTLPIYMGPTALRGIRATGESQVFTPYKFGSSQDRTPVLLTTRPTCYHSAKALYNTFSLK